MKLWLLKTHQQRLRKRTDKPRHRHEKDLFGMK